MHEFSLVENILATLEETARENSLKKITAVTLIIGRLRQVVPDTMRFAFTAASRDTIAQGAELKMELVNVKARCKACNAALTIEDNAFFCDTCGSPDIEVTQGQELLIKTIEGEQ